MADRKKLLNYGLYGLLIVVALLLPKIFPSNYMIELFCQVLINAIAVLGLNVVMGLAGQTHLGTIATVAIGAYAVGILADHTGASSAIFILVALACGALLGLLLGYPSLCVTGVYLALTTTSFAQIVYLLLNNMTEFTGGGMGIKNIPRLSFFGWQLENSTQLYYVIFAITLLVIIFSVRLTSSKFGRVFKAMRDNPDAVESLGIKIANVKIMSFMIATILGCLAGALYAVAIKFLAPTAFVTDQSTQYIVILIVGGIGSTAGILLGSALVTLLPEALRFMGDYYQFIFYMVVLLLVLFCPYGLAYLIGKAKNFIIKKWRGRTSGDAGD